MDQLTVPTDRTATDTDSGPDTGGDTDAGGNGRRPRRGRRSLARRPRRRRFRYTLSGLAGAVLFLCWSLFPSLLPRTGLTRG